MNRSRTYRPGMRRAASGWVAVAAMLLAAGAQAGGYKAPRTSFGAPDLQGTWSNLSLTELERPAGVTALILDDNQAAALERRIQSGRASLPERVAELFYLPDAALGRIDGQARSS